MIVLGLDASSDAAAVGIAADGITRCEYTIYNGKNHSLTLLPMVETMLHELGVDFQDIDAYACGIGPGSFTGVRIGAATVKGFAQAWQKPVIPISSLQLLAENIREFDGLRVSAVHARVNELYCGAYDSKNCEVMSPSVMTVDELLNFLQGKRCKIVGNGAMVFRQQFIEALGHQVVAEGSLVHLIRGGAVAEMGYRLAEQGHGVLYTELSPAYLRESQAEREYKEKHK
ncbi:MAG: tRNA (adenosine(37)-N6)-threonylcarbamoyltransferase complex dimerization subunit type 1 TsaB [Ruminococcaceae bacterium]|nr:tRNA (adenosine(37)-N6)-threonylcarbamoyltransferase complex dimerization subunit type 1 TsaB [Oscillospiraceae bacterium]